MTIISIVIVSVGFACVIYTQFSEVITGKKKVKS